MVPLLCIYIELGGELIVELLLCLMNGLTCTECVTCLGAHAIILE